MANMTNTTHKSLTERLAGARSERPTIANNTTVERDGNALLIRLHRSVIAEVIPEALYVTNAGYDTATTRGRINQVMRDHGLPFYVAQRSDDQVLFLRVPSGEHVALTRDFTTATFDLNARLYSVNGSAPEGY